MRQKPLQNQLPQALASDNPVLPLGLMLMRCCISRKTMIVSAGIFWQSRTDCAAIAADDIAAAEEAVMHATADAVSRYVNCQLFQRNCALFIQ